MGRILMIEFNEKDSSAFNEIMEVLKRHSDFEHLCLNKEAVLTLPGLEIYPERSKIYCDQREIDLTPKEYDLLYLLVMNKGHVLTYGQIYQNVWGTEGLGSENNAVRCHIHNLRDKLYAAVSDAPFAIRCIREVGYCLEVKTA